MVFIHHYSLIKAAKDRFNELNRREKQEKDKRMASFSRNRSSIMYRNSVVSSNTSGDPEDGEAKHPFNEEASQKQVMKKHCNSSIDFIVQYLSYCVAYVSGSSSIHWLIK